MASKTPRIRTGSSRITANRIIDVGAVQVDPDKQITINSLADVNKLYQQEEMKRKENTRAGMLMNMLTRNDESNGLLRTEFLRFLLDQGRDIDTECGYPAWLTPDHYRAMYDREGIAKRVVDCEPEESWAMDPEVYEDEDPNTDTDFEAAWKLLVKQHNLFHHLQRIDVISGIGQYGILLIGLNDGANMMDPVEGFHDDGTVDEGNKYKLTYIRPFSEEVVFVKTRETDTSNPRYGKPTKYTIHFRDFPNWGIQAGEIIARDVHWSRVVHVADNRKMSEIYGVPRMQPVWNRLYDLRKIYASSGEAFWKGAFPGMAFEVNPELADQGVEIDKEGIRKEMESYMSGMQRYLAITGVTAKTLPPTVVDPTGTVETHLKAIAICKAIPFRILFGSEEAKLAASQDSRAWNKRVSRRQAKYISPLIIRPFVDRLIEYGVLPKPVDYFVDWPDLNAPTDQDKATVSLTKVQAMAAYVQGGLDGLCPPEQFLTHIMGMTTEEKDDIIEAASEYQDHLQEDQATAEGGALAQGDLEGDEKERADGQQDEQVAEGSAGGISPPASAESALEQDSLSRSNTAKRKGKKIKQVDAQFVQQPDLNSAQAKKRKSN